MKKKILVFIVMFTLTTQHSIGTKACPANPCLKGGKLDEKNCSELSSWVATGHIKSVKHNLKGPPLNIDLATFEFHPNNWIKLFSKKSVPLIKMKKGWCRNNTELPHDTSGVFKFYGKGDPTHGEYYYLIKQ